MKALSVHHIAARLAIKAAALVTGALAGFTHAQPVSPVPSTSYEYDAQGNRTRVIEAPGVQGFNFVTTRTYDLLRRLKDTTDARSGKTQIDYNGRSDITRVTDPRNLVTQYQRDGHGQQLQLWSPDTGTAGLTYDAAGNLKTRADSRGALAAYTYDALNRVTSVVYSKAGAPSQAYAWVYDQTGPGFSNGTGRLTSVTHPAGANQYAYDALGRLTSTVAVTGNLALTTAYQYDAAGNITALTYPSGRKLLVSYSNGQATAVSLAPNGQSAASPLISAIQWQPFGPVRSWQWHMTGGVQAHDRAYDSFGRPVRYRLGSLLRDLSYDAADRIASYVHYDAATGGALPSTNQQFAYDELGRLSGVSRGAAYWVIGYDANGNRTGVTVNGSTSVYAHDIASNRIVGITNPARSLGYDAAGNTTSSTGATAYVATYDPSNRVVALSSNGGSFLHSSSYSYDADGRRIAKTVQSDPNCTVVIVGKQICPSMPSTLRTTLFVYDQRGHLLGEYLSNGAAIQEYAWVGDTPVAVFAPDPISSVNPPLVFYVHADHLDTPRYVVDKADNVRWSWDVEPFGTTAPSTDPSGLGEFTFNLRFPGQYFDAESGLHYNYFREYDPSIGRYVQSDPIGLGGGINTFLYANAAPTMYTDPTGLFTSSTHNEITTAAIAIAGSPCPNLPAAVANADWFPGAQAPRNAPWHHMRDGTNPNATVDSARGEYNNFVDEQWKSCTCEGLARAMHAIQDSYARGHANFQPWSGGLPSASHAHADAYPSQSERDGAVKASVELIRRHGKECKDQCPK